MTKKTIALYGATGFTGRLVAHELAARGVMAQNDAMEIVISGRNGASLAGLAAEIEVEHDVQVLVRVANVRDAGSLDAMLDGVDVLISCAGPFTDVGARVAEAAIRNGVHYLDTTGEQSYMGWLLEACGARAAERGLVMLSACAFEYAVGDFAAEYALSKGAVHVVVAYATRDVGMSHGTKKSVVRALSEKGLTYVHGNLVERRPAYRLFDVPFPGGGTKKAMWFPGGEALQVPLRGGVTWVESCMVVGEGTAHLLATVSGAIPWMMKLARPVADRIIGMTSGDPQAGLGENPGFMVIAFDPKTGERLATLRGGDPYSVTAKIVVEAATRLFEKPPRQFGFTSAAALFDADSFLEAVGIAVEI